MNAALELRWVGSEVRGQGVGGYRKLLLFSSSSWTWSWITAGGLLAEGWLDQGPFGLHVPHHPQKVVKALLEMELRTILTGSSASSPPQTHRLFGSTPRPGPDPQT